MIDLPYLGHGVGLRPCHYREVVEEHPRIDWFEVISENFMVAGGNPRRGLRGGRARHPGGLPGGALSLGAPHPPDAPDLNELDAPAPGGEPAWVSDHLFWGGFAGKPAHD